MTLRSTQQAKQRSYFSSFHQVYLPFKVLSNHCQCSFLGERGFQVIPLIMGKHDKLPMAATYFFQQLATTHIIFIGQPSMATISLRKWAKKRWLQREQPFFLYPFPTLLSPCGFAPKFNSHVYELKRQAKRETHLFLSCNKGDFKEVLELWCAPMLQKKVFMKGGGRSMLALLPKLRN